MVLRVKLIILCFFAVCTFCYSQCQFGKKNEKQVKNIDSSSIINTIWVYNIADSCQDYLLFKNSTEYENYSCEKGDSIWGIYTIEDDIITLFEQKSAYNDNFPIDSEHRKRLFIWKLQIRGKELIYLKSWQKIAPGEWIEFHVPEFYILTKKE